MDIMRLITGLAGMLAGVILVGYALGWMVRRIAQLVAGGIALSAGALLLQRSAVTVMGELNENKQIAQGMKAARKRLEDQDVPRMLKHAQERGERLTREAVGLWR